MDGVTILNKSEGIFAEIAEVHGMQVFLCILAIIMIFAGWILFFMFIADGFNILTFNGIAMVIAGFMIFTFSVVAHPTRYDVTIDNTVSYNAFTEKYDVIDVNDKIYTVELKE